MSITLLYARAIQPNDLRLHAPQHRAAAFAPPRNTMSAATTGASKNSCFASLMPGQDGRSHGAAPSR